MQRHAGRIISAALGTLDSPYAPLSGRKTLTAEFHFTGIRDGAYENGRRCECQGWGIVLSAVFQCSGYYFLFPPLIFHTIKIPPQTPDSKWTNKHALFAIQTHHTHTAAAEAAVTLELRSTNRLGSSQGECQSDRLSTKLIHTLCFCCTGVCRDYPYATQVTYANLKRAFLLPSVSWFIWSKFSMATVPKPFQGNYFVKLQTLSLLLVHNNLSSIVACYKARSYSQHLSRWKLPTFFERILNTTSLPWKEQFGRKN